MVGKGKVKTRTALRSGIRFEQVMAREAWNKGFFAMRSTGSGSGTSAYPRPDLLIFRPGGVIDVVQAKTTRKSKIRFGPPTWESEVRVARRLRALGFKTRVWLALKFVRPGKTREALIRVDGHEQDVLIVSYDYKRNILHYRWGEARSREE